MLFGNYNKTTYINTSAPALNQTNLNNAEDKIEDIDEELRRSKTFSLSEYLRAFYQRSTKEIEIFDDSSDWTADPEGSLFDNVTSYIMNTQSVRLLEPNNTAGWIGMYKSKSSLNLETFINGEASSTSDIIMIVFYISDVAAFQSIQVKLGDDNTDNYSVYYSSASLSTGWNILIPQKSDFTTNNSPSGWNDITYIRCEAYTNANFQNDYINWQFLQLIREDSDYPGYGNPFQEYTGSAWQNIFSINSDYYTIYFDRAYNKLAISKLNPSNDETQMYIGYTYTFSFIAKLQIICRNAGDTPSLTWWVDIDNYIEVYVNSNTLTMYLYQASSGTTVSQALSTNIIKGEEIEFYLEKDDSTVRLICKHLGQCDVLEATTTITDYGSIYLGSSGTSSYGLVTDFVLTHTQGKKLLDTNPKIIIKETDENISSRTTLQNDDDLICYLEPNSLYEIEMNLIVDGTDSAQDIKVNWSVTRIGGYYYKNCIGPGDTTTSIYNSDSLHMQSKALTTESAYGVVASGWTFVKETALVRTTDSKGTLQVQLAQNTLSGTAITVKKGSYIKYTKIR